MLGGLGHGFSYETSHFITSPPPPPPPPPLRWVFFSSSIPYLSKKTELCLNGKKKQEEMKPAAFTEIEEPWKYPNYGSRKKQLKNEQLEQIMKEIDAEGEEVPRTTLRMVEEMLATLSA